VGAAALPEEVPLAGSRRRSKKCFFWTLRPAVRNVGNLINRNLVTKPSRYVQLTGFFRKSDPGVVNAHRLDRAIVVKSES
jgi:hypothetical protein